MTGAGRRLALLCGLAAAAAASMAVGVKSGPVDLSWGDIRAVFTGGGGALPEGKRMILLGLRIPRAVLGFSVGAALASAGVVFQALLRNPLADPYLLGISGGAALGASGIMLTGYAAAGPLFVPAAAFAGALFALWTVTRLAEGVAAPTPTTMILAGVMVSSFCSAVVMLLNVLSTAARVQGALLWLMGSLASFPPGLVPVTAAVTGAGALYLSTAGHHLNLLSLGDDTARQIGADAGPLRNRLLFVAVLMTGTAVAAGGLIGFVGLVVPHMMRSLFGADHRFLLPAAFLSGGMALVLADSGSRTVLAPVEIPVGVVTALAGAPFFLALLRRRKGWMR